jgi:transposase
MGKLLKRPGFVYKKPKVIHGKTDGKVQEEFLKNELSQRFESACDDNTVYFS